ncbi:MAG: rubrerythrin family protein [Calditrichaeota bacterium]|nr:rubrerythrin family protein [Calditrichota bacterium]
MSFRERKEWRSNLQTELDMAYIYRQLSEVEEHPQIAEVFRRLSEAEMRHARAWEERLKEAGMQLEDLTPSWRAKVLVWLGKRFGAQLVLPILQEAEDSIALALRREKEKRGLPVTGIENAHSRVLHQVSAHIKGGLEGAQLARLEGRHRHVGGNALRAAVLGANDGLVSNLSLVMGVAGAAVSHEGILIAGLAGLLAGAISMALGEWLSVQSSRELYERQIRIEAAELEESPEEEELELALIFQAKGIAEDQARELAHRVISNKDTALDTLAREELGIDPEELGGSAWEAAFTSFGLFALGAIIPVVPFFFTTGLTAVFASLGVSALGLFAIGAAITLFTGRSVWFSGARQMGFGLAAAAITYGIGTLFGVTIVG